jgi:hypothetical protein
MEQSPFWETNRSSASQEIPRILWNPKGVTLKEMERTVKDREKWKAIWDPLYTGR